MAVRVLRGLCCRCICCWRVRVCCCAPASEATQRSVAAHSGPAHIVVVCRQAGCRRDAIFGRSEHGGSERGNLFEGFMRKAADPEPFCRGEPATILDFRLLPSSCLTTFLMQSPDRMSSLELRARLPIKITLFTEAIRSPCHQFVLHTHRLPALEPWTSASIYRYLAF